MINRPTGSAVPYIIINGSTGFDRGPPVRHRAAPTDVPLVQRPRGSSYVPPQRDAPNLKRAPERAMTGQAARVEEPKPNWFAMTREQTRRTLMASAKAASKLIARCVPYVDTVSVLLPRPLERQWLRLLRQQNPGEIRYYPSKARFAPHGYRIHQPSLLTIEHIDTLRHLVSRCDIAVDLIVTSAEAQCVLFDFLDWHLTQPWRGKRQRREVERTRYFGKKLTRRNITIYPCVSKMTGELAVHVEARYGRAAACHRRGVHCIGDLSAFDRGACLACLRRDIRFSAICWRSVGKALDKLAAKRVREHADHARTSKAPKWFYDRPISLKDARRRLIDAFLSAMPVKDRTLDWSDRAHFPAQNCIDVLRRLRVLGDFPVHLPASALI